MVNFSLYFGRGPRYTCSYGRQSIHDPAPSVPAARHPRLAVGGGAQPAASGGAPGPGTWCPWTPRLGPAAPCAGDPGAPVPSVRVREPRHSGRASAGCCPCAAKREVQRGAARLLSCIPAVSGPLVGSSQSRRQARGRRVRPPAAPPISCSSPSDQHPGPGIAPLPDPSLPGGVARGDPRRARRGPCWIAQGAGADGPAVSRLAAACPKDTLPPRPPIAVRVHPLHPAGGAVSASTPPPRLGAS